MKNRLFLDAKRHPDENSQCFDCKYRKYEFEYLGKLKNYQYYHDQFGKFIKFTGTYYYCKISSWNIFKEKGTKYLYIPRINECRAFQKEDFEDIMKEIIREEDAIQML